MLLVGMFADAWKYIEERSKSGIAFSEDKVGKVRSGIKNMPISVFYKRSVSNKRGVVYKRGVSYKRGAA